MKNIYSLFVLILCLSSQFSYAQCGEIGTANFASTQSQLESFSSCEIIYGNLFVSSPNIVSLMPLSSLVAVEGSLYIINTSITSIDELSNLNTAMVVQITGNTNLSTCCEAINLQDAVALGAIMSLDIYNNASGCTNYNDIQLSCLGYIAGCMDIEALNYNEFATQDDGSCEYECPSSDDDLIDASCQGEAYSIDCNSEQIIHKESGQVYHLDNPAGICYEDNPPSSGVHRPMWGKWGEYSYMPAQRYLHNLEHGGIALLYDPCLDPVLIDELRLLACSRPDDDGGEFRWVMTPYPGLPTNIAVVAWEWTYLNDCFDADAISDFIDEHYRNAPEDFYYNGSYTTLYTGKCEAYGCTDPEALNFESEDLIDNGSCEYTDLDTQVVVLNGGWTLFSTYIEPEFNLAEEVFAGYEQNVIIVKNNTGAVYWPDFGFDFAMISGHGFHAKMNQLTYLEVVGEQIQPEEHPIILTSGWNMIAYLRENPADIESVFADVVSDLVIVKDGDGNVYLPIWNYNSIVEMEAGKGYHLNLLNENVLQYLANNQDYD